MAAVLALQEPGEQTEESRRENESRLQSIFRAAPVGIGLVSNRILLDVNNRLCQMTGYRREELVGRNARLLYPTQEEFDRVGREKYRQIRERGTGAVETRWLRKDGGVIDVFLSSTPLDPADLSKGVTFTALDITARKQTENELRSIFDLSLDMVCIANIDTGTFIKINPAFERTLGYSEQELLSRPFIDFIHPDDLDSSMKVLRDRLGKGEYIFSFENRFRCKDGSYRWLNWTSRPQIEQGLTYAIARDITDRKKAEEALQFTQFAIDHTADAAFWMTSDARFFYVNEAACRALGYSCDELLSMTVYDIDPSFTESMWVDTWRNLKAKKSLIFETIHRARDGRVYPVEIRANYLEFGGRQFDCAFARDITERKWAEESLRESEERFRTAFEESAVAMALTAIDTTMLKVNSSFCRMLGYSESELIGRSYTEITHPDDIAANLAGSRQLTSGEISVFRMEKRYLRKDGAVVWADMNTASVPDADGRPLYCVTHIQDITERKQAEEALRRSEARLNRSQEIAHLGSWELDLATNELTWSDEVYRIFGLEPQEFGATYEAFLERVHPDDRRAVDDAYSGSVREGRDTYEIEHRIVRKDTGEVRIVHEKCEHFRDAAGRIVRSFGMVHDITDRKHAEEALRKSEERNRRLIENLKGSHFVYRHDTEGVFRYVSESLTGILGYTPDEFMTHYDKYLTDHPANQAVRRAYRADHAGNPPAGLRSQHLAQGRIDPLAGGAGGAGLRRGGQGDRGRRRGPGHHRA